MVFRCLLAVLAVCAGVWGWSMRRRGKYVGAAFAFSLPILPVLLTLAVLTNLANGVLRDYARVVQRDPRERTDRRGQSVVLGCEQTEFDQPCAD